MATKKKPKKERDRRDDEILPAGGVRRDEVPPGATRAAFDRPLDPGGGPPGSGAGDPHAAGTPGGGTEIGGLGGTNIGDGAPDNADLEEAMAGPVPEDEGDEQGDLGGTPPYSGFSGGAVGGTPAQGRSSGGNIHGGIDPGSTHRGDSTIGSDPEKG
jgi:hypothetical protein